MSRKETNLLERASQRFERGLLEGEEEGEREAPLSPRVVTISRQLGSGGRRIADILGERLNWPVWDREILDALADQSQSGLQGRMFASLDERAQNEIDATVCSLLGRVDKHVYFYLLPRAILSIAQHDAIIVGRGAHVFLPWALRVRVVASPGTRVANLVHYDGVSEAVARERIRESDREREEFLREVRHRVVHANPDLERNAEYDLVLNTDRFAVEEGAAVVMSAVVERFGSEALAAPGPDDRAAAGPPSKAMATPTARGRRRGVE